VRVRTAEELPIYDVQREIAQSEDVSSRRHEQFVGAGSAPIDLDGVSRARDDGNLASDVTWRALFRIALPTRAGNLNWPTV